MISSLGHLDTLFVLVFLFVFLSAIAGTLQGTQRSFCRSTARCCSKRASLRHRSMMIHGPSAPYAFLRRVGMLRTYTYVRGSGNSCEPCNERPTGPEPWREWFGLRRTVCFTRLKSLYIVSNSFLLLPVRPLLLVAMHLFLVASCY